MAADLWRDIGPGSGAAQSPSQRTVSNESGGEDRLVRDGALQRKLPDD
jgi:hypothetical protein